MIVDLLKKHRTKILGATQVGCGAVVSYLPQLQSIMKPIHYGFAMMAVGVSTAVMGFINSSSSKE